MELNVYNNIGLYLRYIRENRSQKSIAKLSKEVGVDKNTLQGYETSRTLPDVDFLAVFAKQTDSGFNELLQVRLASGKTKEARDLAERLKPARPIHETAELEDQLIGLGEDLDGLIEGAEIEADGEGHFAFVDEPEKEEFINKIKSLLINGTTIEASKQAPQTVTKSTLEVDSKLMSRIMAIMAATYLKSPLFAHTARLFVKNNGNRLKQLSEYFISKNKLGDSIDSFIMEVTASWAKYLSVEAGIAAYIYNKVKSCSDLEQQQKLITEEAEFFLEHKLINSALK